MVLKVIRTVALTLLGLFVASQLAWDRWLTKVPRTRDQALVGTWKGSYQPLHNPTPRTREVIFKADGTGKVIGVTKFYWGTENGVLYTYQLANDYWFGAQHDYKLSSTSSAAQFWRVKNFDLVCDQMERQ